MDRTIGKPFYLPGLDGIRALAILAVLLFHWDIFPSVKGAFTGVDIFFVISGYIISRSLYHKVMNSRKPPEILPFLTDFYRRRILRILPALILTLIVTVVLSTLFIPDAWLSRSIDSTGLSAFFGISNFILAGSNGRYFSPAAELNPFLHTWSLAVEEQFYLIFPFIFYLWLKGERRNTLRGLLFRSILPVLTIASMGLAVYGTSEFRESVFFLLPGRYWEISIGALLFILHSEGRFIPKSERDSASLMAGGLFLAFAGFVLADRWSFPYPWAGLPVLSAILMLAGIGGRSDWESPVYRVLSSPFLTYIGRRAYSLYLWHWPVAVIMQWTVGFNTAALKLLGALIAISMAWFSYRIVEAPVRRSAIIEKAGMPLFFAGSAVVLSLTFAASLLLVDNKADLSLSRTKDAYLWHSGVYADDRAEKLKGLEPSIPGRRLFIFGDSHTAAYRTMVHIVSGQLGIESFEYEEGGCAVAGLMEPLSGQDDWTAFYERSMKDIRKKARPGDIVFLASLRMPELSDLFEVPDIGAALDEFFSPETEEGRLSALAEADDIIGELESLGLIVLIDAPKPILKVPLYRCSDWFNRMNPLASPGLSVSRELLEELRAPVMSSLDVLMEGHENLHLWDPMTVLCPGDEFFPFDDEGLPLLWDGDHLSAHGNRLLVPSFREKLLELWRL